MLNCKWFNLSRIHSFNRGMEREGIEGKKSFSLSPLLPPFLPFHFSCPPFFPSLLLSFISSLFFLPFNIVLQINKAPYQMLAWSQRISSDLYLYGVIRSPKILINAIASHFLFFPFFLLFHLNVIYRQKSNWKLPSLCQFKKSLFCILWDICSWPSFFY